MHTPVLLNEVLEALNDIQEGEVIDCTLGFAGHSEAILKLHPNVSLLACDQDDEALEFSRIKLKNFQNRIKLVKSNFSNILSFSNLIHTRAILADIGVSSLQLDKNERGFSIHSDFLDMRMDRSRSLTASTIINSYSQEKLEYIFKQYGELPDAKFIAEKICTYRLKKEINSAKELTQIIGNTRLKGRRISKATLVFQALRIEVNRELEALNNFLTELEKAKPKSCVVVIISFHSLEDSLVKNAFKKWANSCICDEKSMKCTCGNSHNLGKILTKKPIRASLDEIKKNSRASCAKMRIFYFS